MALSVNCPACGKGHKAPERAAGRTVACLNCGTAMTVPSVEPIDPAAILLQDEDPPVQRVPAPELVAEELPIPRKSTPSGMAKKSRTIDVAKLPPLTANDPPAWRRHLHWLLMLALLPLVISILAKSNESSESTESDFEARLEESLKEATPEERDRFFIRLADKDGSIDSALMSLPGQRLHGAFLSRSSMGHWLMALIATILYLTFFMFLASDGSAKPTSVMLVGLFTATIGIGFLLLVQTLASMTGGRMIIGRGVLAIVFLIFKFIAFSYSAAMDPENGFLLSFIGFTLGVGLCEEFVKTVPLFWHRTEEDGKAWRGLFIWGLASGAGFGIAEGIMYSGTFYNGLSGPGIYLVRFISCVALHSIWSGSVGIFLYQKRSLFDSIESWHGWILPTLFVIAVPAVLHGLYDTCLKKEMNTLALVVAFASFGYLAFLFSRLQSVDDQAANEAMLREYKRRKRALA